MKIAAKNAKDREEKEKKFLVFWPLLWQRFHGLRATASRHDWLSLTAAESKE